MLTLPIISYLLQMEINDGWAVEEDPSLQAALIAWPLQQPPSSSLKRLRTSPVTSLTMSWAKILDIRQVLNEGDCGCDHASAEKVLNIDST
jgi:hypothetical protein